MDRLGTPPKRSLSINHVEYLGSRFDVAIPQCTGCGIIYVFPVLARGKMAEVEKILDDK